MSIFAGSWTALMLAATTHGNNLVVIRLLLAAGVDVNAGDRDKQTALHFAALYGSVDVLREFILHSSNMYPLDRKGKTPFDMAYEWGKGDSTDLLIQMYSNRLSQEEEDSLALHTLLGTAEYVFVNIATEVDHGYGDDEEFNAPLHPLRVKIQLGTLVWKYFRTLLLSVDAVLLRMRDDAGKLPIHIACQTHAPVDVLVTLVERDPATLCMADHAGALPLHEYCHRFRDTHDDASALRWLVDRGGVGTLAVRNRDGALPLHVLLCGASTTTTASLLLSAVRYLIQSFPGSVAMRTNAGQYPFMLAASHASSTSLSLIYEIVRANPVMAVPR
jgi:ankyrin repeat protein